MGAMSPKDVMKFTEYIRTRKEAWRVESRRAVEDEFADVAPTINKSDSIASASISSASAASPAPTAGACTCAISSARRSLSSSRPRSTEHNEMSRRWAEAVEGVAPD